MSVYMSVDYFALLGRRSRQPRSHILAQLGSEVREHKQWTTFRVENFWLRIENVSAMTGKKSP